MIIVVEYHKQLGEFSTTLKELIDEYDEGINSASGADTTLSNS